MIPTTHDEPRIADRNDADLGEHDHAWWYGTRFPGKHGTTHLDVEPCGCVAQISRLVHRHRYIEADGTWGEQTVVWIDPYYMSRCEDHADLPQPMTFTKARTGPQFGRVWTGD